LIFISKSKCKWWCRSGW